MSAYFDGDETQYNIEYILLHIGLDVSVFKGKVLDIACGKQAKLVRHLRNLNIAAEGIDQNLSTSESFLIKGDARSIPRPDNYYDFVYSHMGHFQDGSELNRFLLTTLSDESNFDEIYHESKPAMVETIDQAIRVLKPGCKFVIYPSPDYLIVDIGEGLKARGIGIQTEKTLNDSSTEAAFKRRLIADIEAALSISGHFKLLGDKRYYELQTRQQLYRLVLTKP